MKLRVVPYPLESSRWPENGQQILAQYTDDTVVVYQAYLPKIAAAVVANQSFGGGGWSKDRMTWIKPGFLWMMHRSNWARASYQDRILAIFLKRSAFDTILSRAVSAKYLPGVYADQATWQAALSASDVRLQWDPDYPPDGPKLRRRAAQIGLAGETMKQFAGPWIEHIEDITDFVTVQRDFIHEAELLFIPVQRVYPVKDAEIAKRIDIEK